MTSRVTSPDKSVLSKVHRDKSRIAKAARKELHTFVADALDKLPLSANIDDYVVGVKLSTFTRGLLELEEEVSKTQKTVAVYRKLLWENRYCDYLAKTLGKVKSSRAWQAIESGIKYAQWNDIKKVLERESASQELHIVIRLAAKELGFSQYAIYSWIYVYASRCVKNHRKLETILEVSVGDARDQLWADIEQVGNSTPIEYQKYASHILTAIIDYQNTVFINCPKYGIPIMTKQGEKLAGIT